MQKAISNPKLRYSSQEIDWLDGETPSAELTIYEEESRSILSTNDSPDIGFRYSVNPYRGCFHACAYCYARRTHPYLDFGAGTDFERKLVVKINAAQLLRQAFLKPSWQGETVAFSGVTDCYQPLELQYKLTQSCLKVCHEFRNPVVIITKGAIIQRDVELLQKIHRDAHLQIFISVAFSDDEMSQKIEPGAPRPQTRFRALKTLSEAGIPCGVAVAPVIPGLNDGQIVRVLELAQENGATCAFMSLLRLPGEVREVFSERIIEKFPSKAKKILNQAQDFRSGAQTDSTFGQRMRGEGPQWQALRWLFTETCQRIGLPKATRVNEELVASTFQRPQNQLSLW